jgi:pimeloyl-ACP methyl ester carboxylesterase
MKGVDRMKLRIVIAVWVVMSAIPLVAQRRVSFPLVGGGAEQEPGVANNTVVMIAGDLYGSGTRGLILAHGGRFDEKSWKPQAEEFARAGFLVLAVRFRGDRFNPDGSPSAEGSDAENTADVMAAVAYLRSVGAKTVDAIGASLGGAAVGDADARSPGTFERVVFLGSEGGDEPEKLSGRKLFLVADEDRSGEGLRLPGIEAHYKRAPEPKNLVVVSGSAHAQYLFGTDAGPRVMRELMEFLTK